MKTEEGLIMKIDSSIGFSLEEYFDQFSNSTAKKEAASKLTGRLAKRISKSIKKGTSLYTVKNINVGNKDIEMYSVDDNGVQNDNDAFHVSFNEALLLPETVEEFDLAINGYKELISKAEKGKEYMETTGLSPYNLAAKKFWYLLEEKMGDIMPAEARLVLVKLSSGLLKEEDIPEDLSKMISQHVIAKTPSLSQTRTEISTGDLSLQTMQDSLNKLDEDLQEDSKTVEETVKEPQLTEEYIS